MAEVKKVSDQYTISAPTIVIDGNVTITGTTTDVETVNSVIKDAVITLNTGQPGSGITSGSSGIEVDRGSIDKASWTFVQADTAWEAKVGTSLTNIRAATPVDNNDVATKSYVTGLVSGISPGGVNTSVQFNNSSTLGGDTNFTYDGTNLKVFGTTIANNSITGTSTNTDLTLTANGTGTLYLKNVIKIDYQGSDPSSTASTSKIYAKAPNSGGSGVYFVNPTTSDELVSKKRAIAFGLIF